VGGRETHNRREKMESIERRVEKLAASAGREKGEKGKKRGRISHIKRGRRSYFS